MLSIWQDILQSRFQSLPDRPLTEKHSESVIPNVYIAGNLAGQPNIKASIRHGYQLGIQIAKTFQASPYKTDASVGIVGAGPAGVGVALGLQQHGISYIIWERGLPFETIQAFPNQKFLYNTPKEWTLPPGFWFEDCTKEELLKRWNNDLHDILLGVQQHSTVLDIQQYHSAFSVSIENNIGTRQTTKVDAVVLATGTTSQPKKLQTLGEDHPLVQHHLYNPRSLRQKRVVIVGGGNSALEATLLLLEQGAHCKVVHRGKDFSKATPDVRKRLQSWLNSPQLEIYKNSTVQEFRTFGQSENQLTVTIKNKQNAITQHLIVDRALVLIGGQPHNALLNNIEMPTEQTTPVRYGVWGGAFVLFIYLFYLLKSGLQTVCLDNQCMETVLEAKRHFFPLTLSWFNHIPQWFQIDLGFRIVDGAFWGTLLYSLMIVGFGLKAMGKYKSTTQRKRYLSLMIFQVLFLFGIPEILAPWVISTGSMLDFFGGDRPWKIYSLVIPWPLSLYSIVDAPQMMTHPQSSSIALIWTGLGMGVSFLLIPLYVKYQGQRFCSYLCGCGGLAETVGDMFRSFAPKGALAKRLEFIGRGVWILATVITLMILIDAWKLLSIGIFSQAKVFAEHWYSLMVDFWLASVLGVALYPYLGNRVWCRFACPLRAYMETIAKYTTRLSIESKDTCIGCYECTRQCQMGIPVHEYALGEHSLNNQNSACIQCGICIEVCPLNVLEIGQGGQPLRFTIANTLTPPSP